LPKLTPLETAQVELTKLGVPMPGDFMGDLSPVAGLLFLQRTAEAALAVMADASETLGDPADEANPTVSEVLNGVSAALAGTMHALVALEVLPVAAEEAMLKAGKLPEPI